MMLKPVGVVRSPIKEPSLAARTGDLNWEDEAPPASHTDDRTSEIIIHPDVVFIDGGGLALVAADYHKNPSYYEALKAFSNRKVYTLLPFNWYTTNIGTVLADAFAVGKRLYPDRFEDVDPEETADAIYTFLVGKPVYRQMKRDYGPIGGKAPFLN